MSDLISSRLVGLSISIMCSNFSGTPETPVTMKGLLNHFTYGAQNVNLYGLNVIPLSTAFYHGEEFPIIVLHIISVYQNFIVDDDASFQNQEGLSDLMVEDSFAIDWSKEQAFHSS